MATDGCPLPGVELRLDDEARRLVAGASVTLRPDSDYANYYDCGVARALSLTTAAVESLIFRARRTLAQGLEDEIGRFRL